MRWIMKHIFQLKRHGLFDARVPRFTSFPPATWFNKDKGAADAAQWQQAMLSGSDVSLYVHIPFCKRLCWFCACRTQGTKTLGPLQAYVGRVLAEAALVRANLPKDLRVSRLHLGGGTPTILNAGLLDQLLSGLNTHFDLGGLEEFSVEVDPTDVGPKRLDMLVKWGLSRASIGIQDFDPAVQAAIGREQSPELTRDVVEMLRVRGVANLNFDLLYGLPHQTLDSLGETLNTALDMAPDRVALFGYAHVPWMSKRQSMIPADALPNPERRYGLFSKAREEFLAANMTQIGIDHFATDGDGLTRALAERRLKRSFQGYTDDQAPYLIALGASGISTYPEGYMQNLSSTGQYSGMVEEGQMPVARGYALTAQDRVVARIVADLMCYFETDVPTELPAVAERMKAVIAKYEDALEIEGDHIRLKPWAHQLARLIAAEVSTRDPENPSTTRYSQAI